MTLLIILYSLIALFVYGLAFGLVQHSFPLLAREQYFPDMLFSIFIGTFWPLGIILLFGFAASTDGFKPLKFF